MLCWLSLLFVLAGCGDRLPAPSREQPLVIATFADPVFFAAAPDTESMPGFAHELGQLLAARFGAEVRFLTVADDNALEESLARGQAHLIARLTTLPGAPSFLTSPALLVTRQLVVRHIDEISPASREELAGREVAALPRSPQIAALLALGLSPPPIVHTPPVPDAVALLQEVAEKRHALAASTELHLAVAVRQYPDLVEAVELPGPLAYVWQFRPEDAALAEAARALIEEMLASGELRRLSERYFAHIRRADAQAMRRFLERVRLRLPEFRPHFERAEEITGIDWRLLAALAYQESHWDPFATSPTGVRGMMMLTEETADRLGVKNRLDAKESILAGAKYLAMLRDELPPSIKEPDRLWFALAAYNLGRGHLNGARAFAPSLGRDPDSWLEMKEVLPLMSRPEYYARLKSGRARGGEALIMVENVRNYYDVLVRIAPRHAPPLAGQRTAEKKPQRGRSASSPAR